MASKRYLSILFADLVGYTTLSEQLDPELLGEVQHAYQALVAAVVGRHGGYLASCWGDGAMAYFGWPSSHENDAQLAIVAALEIADRVPRLEPGAMSGRPPMGVRVGVHTGLVMVGPKLLGGPETEADVIGMAANMASRIQTLAPTNGVLASEETMDLVRGLFDSELIGYRTLRGISKPMALHRVIGLRNEGSRSLGRMSRGAIRMVGRTAAQARLLELWSRAGRDGCRVVQVMGEPGIGKTRLVQEFCRDLGLSAPQVMTVSCVEMFASSPLHPAIGFFRSKIGLRPEQSQAAQLSLLRSFLSERGCETDQNVAAACALLDIECNVADAPTASQLRHCQFTLIAGLVERVARAGPSVLWVDDVHWIDPSSAELLVELARRLADVHILILLTQRGFPSISDLPAIDETVHLRQLDAHDALALAQSVPGSGVLAARDLSRVVEAAEGIPLYIEQLIFALLRQQSQMQEAGDAPLLPLSLSELMSSRLDRVDGGRRFAQVASCVGRSFEAGFVASLLGVDVAASIRMAQQLMEAEILLPGQEDTDQFVFRHALLHRVAYDSMLRQDRQRTHAAIHRLLSAPDWNRPVLPELLAQHLTRAGETVPAVGAWIAAGGQAARRSAHAEALAHFEKAAGLLGQVADPGVAQDLEVRMLAGKIAPISATHGSSSLELEACCRRGLQLSLKADPSPLVFPFLYGQCTVLMTRASTDESLDLARLFVSLAERKQYAVGQVIARRLVGMALISTGALVEALGEVEHSLRIFDEAGRPSGTEMYGHNAQVYGGSLLGLITFCLGQVDRGIEIGLQALFDADELRHPHSTAIAISFASWIIGLCGDHASLNLQARRLIRTSEAHNLGVFRSIGTALLGWSFCLEGELDQGIAVLDRALAEFQRAEFGMTVPGYLAVLSDAQRRRGNISAARRLSAQACDTVAPGNVWLEPEVFRVAALVAERDQIGPLLAKAAARARALSMPVLEARCLRDLQEFCAGAEREAVSARLASLAFVGNLAERIARPLGQGASLDPTSAQV